MSLQVLLVLITTISIIADKKGVALGIRKNTLQLFY